MEGDTVNAEQKAGQPVLEIRGLSKSFPGTKALDRVDLDVVAGEIHALVGSNGCGKSTLIKILTGVYQGDPGGTIRVGGVTVAPADTSPEVARSAGIHVVHQDLGVFPDLSVAENVALGHGYELAMMGSRVRWRAQRQRAQQLIDRFEIEATPNTPLRSLSQAARTQVAIARAMQNAGEAGDNLLILDEPTSSLPAHEVDLLFTALRRYAAQGQAILFVSHRLGEVLDFSDRVSALRDGKAVGTFDAKTLDEEELIKVIVGRSVDRVFPEMPTVRDHRPLLELRNVDAGPLRDINLSVARGEVVGIAGLLGCGRTELLRTIFGDLDRASGEILLDGKDLRLRSPRDAMESGIALVPEDRASEAAFSDLPVFANVTVANSRDYWRRGVIRFGRMKRDGQDSMKEFLIKAASADSPLGTLSGGNQQKAVLARWLRRKPRVLLLDEPTQGVDVGAKEEIYALVRKAVSEGAAALVVASDFEELAHVSDRVLVLNQGRITAEMTRESLSAEKLTGAANRRVEV
jgi:ribose transport system ATP-binding protein